MTEETVSMTIWKSEGEVYFEDDHWQLDAFVSYSNDENKEMYSTTFIFETEESARTSKKEIDFAFPPLEKRIFVE